MAEGPEQDDKTEEPTQKRLDDARAKGDVIYSTEATSWAMLAAGALAILALGETAAEQIGTAMAAFLAGAGNEPVSGAGLMKLMARLGLLSLGAIGLVFLALTGAAILSRYVQDKAAFSTERLKPKLERVNPIDGFKRVFGAQALANFLKALAKLVIVGGAAVWALWPRDAYYETGALIDLTGFFDLAEAKLMKLLFACLAAFTLVALADYVYTSYSHKKRLRMTRRELKDEFRESEGDPLIKAKIRQIRMSRASKRMMAKVPEASVVVANPTHYAVALKYDRAKTPAPICVAKGVDEIALKIRETAEAHNVPVVEDPPLARALFGAAELDQPIPREHYEAVARVIGFVMRLAQRRRPARPGPRSPGS
jgi:flagellar biosynthetic protein FlhB